MIDYTNTPDGDLDITSGDLSYCASTQQHKSDILLSSQGDYKETPTVGVGLIDYLNCEDNGMMLRNISQQMQRDGIDIKRIGYDTHGDLLIDGDYDNNNSRK